RRRRDRDRRCRTNASRLAPAPAAQPARSRDRGRGLGPAPQLRGDGPITLILTDGVAPELLEPPVNTLRVSLHPGGLAPRIGNFAEYSAHRLHRIDRSAVMTADPDLTALADELRGYPGVIERSAPPDAATVLFVPLILRSGDQKLAFFSTIATFGTALDITAAELAIE